MAFSRQARIITLLVIDSVFFLIELITGYAVGSLALVADSFHMLNDVLSLVVALYTIKLATAPSSAANSYGWQRAEVLGALINGVFLVALCMSIGLEAIGRIVAPPEITNPKLIVLVGSLGLLSNFVGLFLFHEHGHSHGGHSHGPIGLDNGEEENDTLSRENSVSDLYQHPAQTRAQVIETAQEFGYGSTQMASSFDSSFSPHHHGKSLSQNDTLPPFNDYASGSSATVTDSVIKPSNNHEHSLDLDYANEQTPLKVDLAKDAGDAEVGHSQAHPHGHGHGSMNMRGVFLHVVGDALGNVGVIAAGLVIWLCHGRWTLYFDPAVSLLITCIIFSSALPLVKSASYILLQGVPSHVSLDAVRQSIVDVDGVDSVHELHIWQLSESTVVASVHVLIDRERDYMIVANGIREKMHAHGIHSVTIQPEFYEESEHGNETCRIRCPPEQCNGDTCCPPASSKPVSEDGNDRHDSLENQSRTN
nr:solute carrier family 30 (zinc transporter), member 1 [Cryptococcus depauperatus CBS 7841]